MRNPPLWWVTRTDDGFNAYPDDDDQKVKTQRPRSADQPGVFQAQTGDPAAEEWSQWSVCSLTCGQGWQVRTRSCVSSPYGTLCSGPLRETRQCNNTATCPGMVYGNHALLNLGPHAWMERCNPLTLT
ncbi:hypothetical protein AALO_G00252380 [Alosa alosa]|uniref:Uncharacterized protein n=1 Tax=Alosa alosa TaxID=278164 RepID=A0AAV6FRB6_9TELE|nr:hypothetical protein AALO_G00252380 [Alosa alosa]